MNEPSRSTPCAHIPDRHPNLAAAEQELLRRKSRAVFAGNPPPRLTAYPCSHCSGAHIVSTKTNSAHRGDQ